MCKNNVKTFVLTTIIMFCLSFLWSAYVTDFPVQVKQPDGSILKCFASGDEYYNWLHDANNFTIMQSPTTGYYVYAEKFGDNLRAGNLIVGRTNPSSLGLTPGLNISKLAYKSKRDTRSKGYDLKYAPTSGTIQSLTVFIRFNDDAEYTDNISIYDDMMNNTTSGYNSMRNYFSETSYGALTVISPFYPAPSGGIVTSYKDSHDRNYFRPYNATTNLIGYQTDEESRLREHGLLRDASNFIAASVSTDLIIDGDNDGKVDNVTFIIKGANDGWSDMLWPHMWSLYSYDVTINGKRVYNYNFQLQDHLVASGNGVMCHEFFHTLGAPDLYHYTSNGITPAGKWDVMQSNLNPPQHMSAFMKMKYGHWITSIPTITTDQLYTLNPATSTSGQAYRIDSPNSTTEYYIVEYRSKTGTFESSIPGSGLLVWRINTTVGDGNADGPPDEVYVYRPGGTTITNGTVDNANFSLEANRTLINDTTSPSGFLTNGSVGGLSLYHIGSAGSTISFNKGPAPEGTIDFSINPVTENFDGTYFPSDGWSNIPTTGTYSFSRITTESGYLPHSASYMLKYDSWNAPLDNSANFVSPQITITSTTLYSYSLSFWMFRYWGSDTSPDRVLVYTNTTNNLSGTPTLLGTVYRCKYLEPYVSSSTWYQFNYNLNFTSTGNKYVILQAISGSGYSIYLDDVVITRTALGTIPTVASTPVPANSAINQLADTNLSWNAATSSPDGYRLYLGTNNPPSNLINGTDLGNVLSYNPTANLQYSTQYFWKIVSYNGYGDALNCPVWSFTTTNDYQVSLPGVDTGSGTINPVIEIPGITGTFNPEINVEWAPPTVTDVFPTAGLAITLSNGSFAGLTINITHDLGFVPTQLAFKILPATNFTIINNPGSWTASDATLTIPASKADGDVQIVFPNGEDTTLPVELSAFTGICTSSNGITLSWATQSESDVLGFNIFRSETDALENALMINSKLIAGTNTSTVQNYTYSDIEPLEIEKDYYYWLQSAYLSGNTMFFGPVHVKTGSNPTEPSDLVLITSLKSVFPNPFNPETTIEYSMKENGNVSLDIFNLKGQIVRTLFTGEMVKGTHKLVWDGKNNSGNSCGTGIFVLKMKAGKYTTVKKITILK